MNSIQNFLEFLNNNLVSILVCIGLIISIAKKAKSYLSKSDEEKITVAKQQITETMLKLITDAEVDYESWNEAGSIKRSQVIKEIFEKYPILAKAVDQQEIIDWIDNEIKESLKTLRKIVEENKEEEVA